MIAPAKMGQLVSQDGTQAQQIRVRHQASGQEQFCSAQKPEHRRRAVGQHEDFGRADAKLA